MRLYLSSFRTGDHPEHLVALIGRDGRRSVVIANAMDDAPPDVRRAGVELELAALADLGLDAAELDLRDYAGQQGRLRQDLAGFRWPGCAAAIRSCFAMPCSAAAPTICFGNCLPRTRWSMPGTAPGSPPAFTPYDPGDELAERCIALAAALGLEVAGLDLKLAPDGRIVCLEVNPSPVFSYYQLHTGQPIADAIARLLNKEAA